MGHRARHPAADRHRHRHLDDHGWTVTFTLPPGHTITGSWNGAVTVSGRTVTFRNAAHNGTLAPGAATTSPGFQAARPAGDTALPSGYACA
ncbi:cellulose binding domain-containing protein [Nonomuraea sp. NPDC005692]|uniref:cellulose binding domain-containing protein n=1 Tax=Nonomuraea sp. NPDC005692 TaxID=3157168 RepID=UPI0033F44969